MYNQKLQTIGFFILLGLALLISLFLFWPFLELIALAGILAVLFKPVHKNIQMQVASPGWSALLTVLLVIAIVLLPLSLIGYVLYIEVANVISGIQSGSFSISQAVIIQHLPQQLHTVAQSFLSDLSTRFSSIAGNAVQSVAGILTNIVNFFFACVVVFFSLYYFLRDGDRLKNFFNRIFPLSEAHEVKLVDRIEQAINGIIKGSFLVALTQGSIALIGFLIFGVPQPFLWAAFTVLAALVPPFGTSLSLIPAILYLFLTGHTGAGIGMSIWGAAAVGTIDNFVGPRLIGGRAKLHPLLVLFAVIGGIQLFGPLGFLLGPIVIAVLMALLEIYQAEAHG